MTLVFRYDNSTTSYFVNIYTDVDPATGQLFKLDLIGQYAISDRLSSTSVVSVSFSPRSMTSRTYTYSTRGGNNTIGIGPQSPIFNSHDSITLLHRAMYFDHGEEFYTDACRDNSVMIIPIHDSSSFYGFVRSSSVDPPQNLYNYPRNIHFSDNKLSVPIDVYHDIVSYFTEQGATESVRDEIGLNNCTLQMVQNAPDVIVQVHSTDHAEEAYLGYIVYELPISHNPVLGQCVLNFDVVQTEGGSIPLLRIPNTHFRITRHSISLCDSREEFIPSA